MTNRNLLIGILIGLLATGWFFLPLVVHLDRPLEQFGDVAYGYFLFDNNLSKLAAGSFADLFNTRMFFPLTNTLAFGNSMLGQSLLGLPVYLFTHNVILSSNIVMLLDYFLSYLFTYLLIYRLTQDQGGSVLGGIVYAFNPYMSSRLHQELIVFQWIPLGFLGLEMLLEKVRLGWAAVLVLSLLLSLSSSFYYFFYLLLFLPVYLSCRMVLAHIPLRHFFHASVIVGAIFLAGVSWYYLLPFLQVKQAYRVSRPVDSLIMYSAGVVDFFMPQPANQTYGWVTSLPVVRFLRSDYSGLDPSLHPYEHNLFPGVLAMVSLISCLWLWYRRRFRRGQAMMLVAWLIILGLTVLLAFGPYLVIGGRTIPFLYFLLAKLPLVDSLRVPSRVIVIGYLALAVVVGYVWSWVRQRLTGRVAARRVVPFLFLGLALFLSWEYRFSLGPLAPVNPEIGSFYTQLDHEVEVRAIVELPMSNGGTFRNPLFDRVDEFDAIYLFYSLYHHKRLVNGYNGFIPDEYRLLGKALDDDFPTEAKLAALRHLGVDTVVVHLEEYQYKDLGKIVLAGFRRLGIRQILHVGTLYAFRI